MLKAPARLGPKLVGEFRMFWRSARRKLWIVRRLRPERRPPAGDPTDPFGLLRERKITESGVRGIFTPHRPVDSIDLFFGRQSEVRGLIEQINTPGQHALLYGDRGVGKSSLANAAADLLFRHIIDGKVYPKRCDSDTTFLNVVALPLRDAGIDLGLKSRVTALKEGGQASVGIPGLGAGVKSDRETTETYAISNDSLSASDVAEALADSHGLLIVDEADAITSKEDRRKLAQLIKLLSDADSPFKILVVGIASTGADLIAGHPSVQRCLKETRLRRMTDRELAQIVSGGADALKLTFEEPAIRAIVGVSSGYPHFTQLLALKAAEDAIAEDRKIINKSHLKHAMEAAVRDAEGTLKRAYDDAVRSHSTDMYRIVLDAAASVADGEFSAQDLRAAISRLTGRPIAQPALNNYLSKLVSTDHETILRRTGMGVYCFNDPRMPSYIKIVKGELED